MKALVPATVLTASSPADMAEPEGDPYRCSNFGQEIVPKVIQAREKGTLRADFLTDMGLMDHSGISTRAKVPATVGIILDSVFLLCIRPLDRDRGGEIAREFMANLCHERFGTRRRG
jgi:hypothetical protein